MKPNIVNSSASPEIFIAEGCFIVEVWNTEEDPDLSVARARVVAHTETLWHYLDVDERYFISEGTGVMEIEGESPVVVTPGDVIAIPAGVAQRIRNETDHELIFYCLCTPRFKPGTYHQCGEPSLDEKP